MCLSPLEYDQASEDLKLAQAAASSGGGGKKSKLAAAAAAPVDRPMFVEVSVAAKNLCGNVGKRCDMLIGLQ